MKIIFVDNEFKMGGVASNLLNMLNYIVKSEDQVEFHVLYQKVPFFQNVPERVKIVRAKSNYNKLIAIPFVELLKNWKKIGIRTIVKRFIISLGFHLNKNFVHLLYKDLYSDNPISSCDVCIVLKECRESIYYALSQIKTKTYICYFVQDRNYVPIFRDIYINKIINHIVTVSEGNRQYLINKEPSLSSKTHVLHNYVNPQAIINKASAFRPDYDHSITNICTVGRICEEKGFDVILQAVELLQQKKRLPSFRWYVIGPYVSPTVQSYCKKKLNEGNLKDHIVITGPMINPYPYIKDADLVVNPSIIESYGIIIREAQILGTPVLSSETDGGRELIEGGKTGFLVPAGNAVALAIEIEHLLTHKELLHKTKSSLAAIDYDERMEIKEKLYDLF